MPKKPVDACLNCRGRHVKCDDKTPRCRRCETRGLKCTRVKGVFRQGSAAKYDTNFKKDQHWVDTGPMQLQFAPYGTKNARTRDDSTILTSERAETRSVELARSADAQSVMEDGIYLGDRIRPPERPRWHTNNIDESIEARNAEGTAAGAATLCAGLQHSMALQMVSTVTAEEPVRLDSHPPLPGTQSDPREPSNSKFVKNAIEPLSSLFEACLLRYYIEEIAQLFDTNDDRQLFQLLVPKRALGCPPLLHAICAVAARGLACDPKYRKPEGICYQNNLLSTLDTTTAVEYMLKCIPFLFEFHNATDEAYQENIIVAAVILRQYEEMDEEAETSGNIRTSNISDMEQRANFLAVTQGIIDTCASFPTFAHETLAHAAFWIAVRQEVYESFMREEAPKMMFDKYHFGPVSPANRLVMHAAEVTRWNWGAKTDEEWVRLNTEQQQFDFWYGADLIPIYSRAADTAQNEVFPSIWYASDAQIVSVQHFELARMILIAEKPSIDTPPTPAIARAIQRKAEALVRGIILKLCGIAFSNPACKPALVSATMAISLYGDYFTDEHERGCLLMVFEKMLGAHVWPVQRKRNELVEKWKAVDDL